MTWMPFTERDFPVNQVPVYDFHMDDDGNIVRDVHVRYVIVDYTDHRNVVLRDAPPPSGRYDYRLFVRGNVVVKRAGTQMEQYCNRHLFTLTDDADRARRIITAYYEAKAASLAEELDRCNAALSLLARTASPLFPEQTNDKEEPPCT